MTASPTRRRIVGISTKMYFSASRTRSYIQSFLSLLSQPEPPNPNIVDVTNIDIFLIPDFITLSSAIRLAATSPTPLFIGAQDCHSADAGAFTGEVSPAVLAEVGVRIVELGHAERRRHFGETDESTAAKAAAVVRNGMLPLVCIGEVTRGEVDVAAGEVIGQVRSVLAAVPDEAEIILAYEPVWAIGAADPAGVEHVVGVVGAIRDSEAVKGRKGVVRILYGGSAGPGLFKKFQGAVDGLFLGRFAHDPKMFYRTVCEVAGA